MIEIQEFGTLPSGEIVRQFTLSGARGFRVSILSYGASLQSVVLPNGRDVVLGFDNLEAYLGDHGYMGAAIGRVANRISGAQFSLEGETFSLPKNEGENNLHSDPDGFERQNWVHEIDDETLILRHTSPDGHQGFPGEVSAEYRFQTQGTRLYLEMRAATTKPTPINITYHPYFNFAEGAAGEHWLWVNADHVLEMGEGGIPSGAFLSVESRDLDFREAMIERVPSGLDDCFVLNHPDDPDRDPPVILMSSSTRDGVAISTSYPACQIYTGEHIPKSIGKDAVTYGPKSGIAIEPQAFTDAPNRPEFPSIILRPNEAYRQTIRYSFFQGLDQA